MTKRAGLGILLFVLTAHGYAQTAPPQPPPRTTITRATSPITIDGDITDSAWQNAARFETWYETNPGDNVPPSVKNLGLVTYDDRFLYVAFDLEDPDPKQIRAPYADHDAISGQSDDFAGVLIDSRNDGKTAVEMFVTARNVQYDAITDDGGNGEDSSPDFFWDSATKIHARGWSLEMRIPFSSLRYESANPEQWGFLMYRNMPRDRRVQMWSNRLPRDSNCFVCNYGKITGLTGLPTGDHMVIAPYATANQVAEPRFDDQGRRIGEDLHTRGIGTDMGLDFKWSPTADMAVDATLNPDFSQIESDVAVISTNERFAISLPEKRPFFLEGIDLFTTPIQAVYTRTITSPRWGARTTGKSGKYGYTALIASDRGGGVVILPSAEGSDSANQDFSSTAFIGRVKRDLGRNSFVSFLATTREAEGGAYNRVLGPDFQFRLGDHHTFTGQVLVSSTQNPNRIDLSRQWTGNKLESHGAYGWYQFATDKVDFFVNYNDYGDEFRADNGFVPQVGYRGSYFEGGRTYRPKGFFNRVRVFAFGQYDDKQNGDLLYRLASAGFGADGRKRSFWRARLARDTVTNAGEQFDRNRLYFTYNMGVNRVLSYINFDGWIGDEVDFFRNRLGKGASINSNATLRPTNHLQINLLANQRWVNIRGDRLFTAQVERIRATYTFNSRMFVRAIVQNTRTNRDRALYEADVPQRSGGLGSQVLFAYKLNWQTVFFLGGGDLREVVSADGDFLPANRQIFAKVSYAFQR
jgi:Domain of unknown function (DUF5916)/Carbohydrate family 9 binding domain-like